VNRAATLQNPDVILKQKGEKGLAANEIAVCWEGLLEGYENASPGTERGARAEHGLKKAII
jgi:hypothetical protein